MAEGTGFEPAGFMAVLFVSPACYHGAYDYEGYADYQHYCGVVVHLMRCHRPSSPSTHY